MQNDRTVSISAKKRLLISPINVLCATFHFMRSGYRLHSDSSAARQPTPKFLITTVGLQLRLHDVLWRHITDLVSRVLSQSQPRIYKRCRTIRDNGNTPPGIHRTHDVPLRRQARHTRTLLPGYPWSHWLWRGCELCVWPSGHIV